MVLKREDWVGRKFGRLTVVDIKRFEGAGSVLECQCECGVIINARSGNLNGGSTASCGCLALEARSTHRMTSSRVYVIWRGMKSRCRPNSRHAPNYYNRGITVCKRWRIFENFYEDMGDPPDNYTLERIDNNKGYSPDNCKWATYEENLSNRRNNNLITVFGKTQTLTRWAREAKLPVSTLKNRLYRAKMRPEDALIAPLYAQQRGKIK
jgi:hypothetical protein